MKLTGAQIEVFTKALQSAFPTRTALSQMLRVKLDKKLNEIASENDNLTDTIFCVFEKAESENWLNKLLQAARESNPDNQQLKDFEESILPQNVSTIPHKKPQNGLLCEEIRTHVAQGRINKAIGALLDLSKNTDKYDAVNVLSGQFHQLESEKMIGIIESSVANVRLASITNSILSILGKLCE